MSPPPSQDHLCGTGVLLDRQGIKVETSAPHTPQQNGIAERMNRTLKEKTRTLLAQAEASPTLWKEDVLTAVHLYNCGAVVNRHVTPSESFLNEKPDVSGFRVWGCLAHVLIPDGQRSALLPKTVSGMFTGYEPGSKAYRVYLGGRQWKVSRDVFFFEKQSGAGQAGAAVSVCELDWDASVPAAVNTHTPQDIPPQFSTRASTVPLTAPPPVPVPVSGPHPSAMTWEQAQILARGGQIQTPAHQQLLTVQENIRKTPPQPRHSQRLADITAAVTIPTSTDKRVAVPGGDSGCFGSRQTQRQPLSSGVSGYQTVGEVTQRQTVQEIESKACQLQVPGINTAAAAGMRRASTEDQMFPATRDPTVLHSPVSPECVRVCQAKPEYVSHTSSVHATTIAGGSSPHDWQKVRGHESTAFSSCAPSCNFVGRPDSHEVLQENLNFNTAIPPGIRFSKVPVPSNLKEARQSQQWSHWSQAMDEEKSSLDAHDTMEYVERPTGHKVIPVHWIFSTKVDDYGNVLRFKARLVAQGCRQIPGIDVGEVFAPTSSFGTRRAILAVGAALDFEIHQVDIKTAFLNGDLEEEVYVSQPPGYENGNPRVVCRLRKALYGLKQAPRAWHKTFDVKLQSMGYFPCKIYAGVYVKTSASGENHMS